MTVKLQIIEKPKDTIIDDNFAKQMGAKDLVQDLKKINLEKQMSSQYKQALLSITNKRNFRSN